MSKQIMDELITALSSATDADRPGLIRAISIVNEYGSEAPAPAPAPAPIEVYHASSAVVGSKAIEFPMCQNCGKDTGWNKFGQPFIICLDCADTMSTVCIECGVEPAYYNTVTGIKSELCKHCHNDIETDRGKRHKCATKDCNVMIPLRYTYCSNHVRF